MKVGLPLSRDEFDDEKQQAFKESIASAAGVDVPQVVITSIEAATIPRRSLLAEGIEIDVEVEAEDAIAAESISSTLTAENMNAQLQSAGLPEAQVLSAPAVVQTTIKSTESQKAKSNSTSIIIASVASLAGVSLVTAVIVLIRRLTKTKSGQKESGINQSLLPHQPNIMMPDASESQMIQFANSRRAETQQASGFSDSTVVDVEEVRMDDSSASRSQDIGFAQSPADPRRTPQQDKRSIAGVIKDMRRTGQLVSVTADAHLGFMEIQNPANEVLTPQNPKKSTSHEPVAQWGADSDPAAVTSGGVAARQDEQVRAGLLGNTIQSLMAAPGLTPEVARQPSKGRDMVKALWSSVTGDESDEDEDQKTDTVLECVVCMQRQKNRMLQPCGHVCVCQDCSSVISKCPLCRSDVTGTVPAFI